VVLIASAGNAKAASSTLVLTIFLFVLSLSLTTKFFFGPGATKQVVASVGRDARAWVSRKLCELVHLRRTRWVMGYEETRGFKTRESLVGEYAFERSE
jgi:hypothetical protein